MRNSLTVYVRDFSGKKAERHKPLHFMLSPSVHLIRRICWTFVPLNDSRRKATALLKKFEVPISEVFRTSVTDDIVLS